MNGGGSPKQPILPSDNRDGSPTDLCAHKPVPHRRLPSGGGTDLPHLFQRCRHAAALLFQFFLLPPRDVRVLPHLGQGLLQRPLCRLYDNGMRSCDTSMLGGPEH